MAKRPIFVPNLAGPPFVEEITLEFAWSPGFAKTQAQKSIASLHEAAAEEGLSPILEISSKSKEPLGVSLSAFNLMLEGPGQQRLSVECAFQGSKVFERGGPYTDLYVASSRDAKTDERVRGSGKVVGFEFFGEEFPTTPPTAFYDWLYIGAVWQNPCLAEEIERYAGFSDIAFNPDRSINCQARSAALFLALKRWGLVERAAGDKGFYLGLISGKVPGVAPVSHAQDQLTLPL